MPLYYGPFKGRTATYILATSDAPDHVKAQADDVFTGANDHLKIQAMITAITDVGEIAILGANFSLSNKVTIDLATKRISIRGQNTKLTLGGAAGIPGFEILNQPAYRKFQPALSGFLIDGQDRASGRVGVKLTDNIYCPVLENLEIYNCNKAIENAIVFASQQEGLTLKGVWLWDNNYGIYYPDSGAPFSFEEPFWDDLNIVVPANGVGIQIGAYAGLSVGYIKMTIWLVGANAKGIYLDGNLNGTTIKGRLSIALASQIGIDIGLHAFQPQRIQTFIGESYMDGAVNNPNNRDVRISELWEPGIKVNIPSLLKAEVELPMKDAIGNYLSDVSGHYHNVLLENSPTWGTQGQLGKLTFNGTTQSGISKASVPLNGDRTWIVVCSPNFLESEDATRTALGCGIQATSIYAQISKRNNASSNVVWFMVSDGTHSINAGAALGFAQNGILVLIGTFKASTGQAFLYANGSLRGAATDAAMSMPATLYPLFLAQAISTGEKWKGDIMFVAQLPRYVEDVEAAEISSILLKLPGVFKVKNSAAATIAPAGTSIVVSHGLVATPSRVIVSPITDAGIAIRYWADTYTSTQFTIHCSPATTNALIFDWKAQVGEG